MRNARIIAIVLAASGLLPLAAGCGRATESGLLADGSGNDMSAPSTFRYRGTGQITFRDDQYPFDQDNSVTAGPKELVFDVTRSSSPKKQVNEGLQKKLGRTTFHRISRDDLKAHEQKTDGFVLVDGLIYADSVTRRDGSKLTLSEPLPVFSIPGAKGTFAGITSSGLVHKTKVSGDGEPFEAIMTVSKEGESDDALTAIFKLEIPSDKDGKKYEALGLPHEARYAIDIMGRVVKSISTKGFYHTDRNPGTPQDKMEEMQNGPGGAGGPQLPQLPGGGGMPQLPGGGGLPQLPGGGGLPQLPGGGGLPQLPGGGGLPQLPGGGGLPQLPGGGGGLPQLPGGGGLPQLPGGPGGPQPPGMQDMYEQMSQRQRSQTEYKLCEKSGPSGNQTFPCN